MADDLDIQEQEDGSALVDMPEIETEEQPDGSAIVELDDGPEFNPEFYDNLADTVDLNTMSDMVRLPLINMILPHYHVGHSEFKQIHSLSFPHPLYSMPSYTSRPWHP